MRDWILTVAALLVLFYMLFAAPARAEEAPSPGGDEERERDAEDAIEIVVTATRRETEEFDVPRHVSVVTAKEAREKGRDLGADIPEFAGYGKISKFHGYAVHGGGSRTFELEVEVLETPLPLKYGSTADLRIIVGRRSILKILLGIEDRAVVQTGRLQGVTPTPTAGAGSHAVGDSVGKSGAVGR